MREYQGSDRHGLEVVGDPSDQVHVDTFRLLVEGVEVGHAVGPIRMVLACRLSDEACSLAGAEVEVGASDEPGDQLGPDLSLQAPSCSSMVGKDAEGGNRCAGPWPLASCGCWHH